MFEENLKNLREMNLDARPESEQEVMGRIAKLRSDLESASLALKEAEIEKELQQKLKNEFEHDNVFVSALSKENIDVLREKLTTLVKDLYEIRYPYQVKHW